LVKHIKHFFIETIIFTQEEYCYDLLIIVRGKYDPLIQRPTVMRETNELKHLNYDLETLSTSEVNCARK